VEDVTFIVISMVVIVAVAGLVVAFTAFPHRGEDMPGVPWLGEAMDRASGVVPTLDDSEQGEIRSLAGRFTD
jgi:hypothetical protein